MGEALMRLFHFIEKFYDLLYEIQNLRGLSTDA